MTRPLQNPCWLHQDVSLFNAYSRHASPHVQVQTRGSWCPAAKAGHLEMSGAYGVRGCYSKGPLRATRLVARANCKCDFVRGDSSDHGVEQRFGSPLLVNTSAAVLGFAGDPEMISFM